MARRNPTGASAAEDSPPRAVTFSTLDGQATPRPAALHARVSGLGGILSHRRSFPTSTEEMRAALQLLPQHLLESTGIREAVLQPGVAPEALVRKHTLSDSSAFADSSSSLSPSSPLFIRPHGGKASCVRRLRSAKNAASTEDALPPSVEAVLQQSNLLRKVLSRMRSEEQTALRGDSSTKHCVYCAGHLLVAGTLTLEAESLLFNEDADLAYRRSLSAGLGTGVSIHLKDVVECACVRAPPLDDLVPASSSSALRVAGSRGEEGDEEEGDEPTFLQLLLRTLGQGEVAFSESTRPACTRQEQAVSEADAVADDLSSERISKQKKETFDGGEEKTASSIALAAAHAPPWSIPVNKEQRRQYSRGGLDEEGSVVADLQTQHSRALSGEDHGAREEAETSCTEREAQKAISKSPNETSVIVATDSALSVSREVSKRRDGFPGATSVKTNEDESAEQKMKEEVSSAHLSRSREPEREQTDSSHHRRRSCSFSSLEEGEVLRLRSASSQRSGGLGAEEQREEDAKGGGEASSRSAPSAQRRASLSEWLKAWRPTSASAKNREEATASFGVDQSAQPSPSSNNSQTAIAASRSPPPSALLKLFRGGSSVIDYSGGGDVRTPQQEQQNTLSSSHCSTGGDSKGSHYRNSSFTQLDSLVTRSPQRLFVLFAFPRKVDAHDFTRQLIAKLDEWRQRLAEGQVDDWNFGAVTTNVPCSSNAVVEAWQDALDQSAVWPLNAFRNVASAFRPTALPPLKERSVFPGATVGALSLNGDESGEEEEEEEFVSSTRGTGIFGNSSRFDGSEEDHGERVSGGSLFASRRRSSLDGSGREYSDGCLQAPGQEEMRSPRARLSSFEEDCSPEMAFPAGAATFVTPHIATQIALHLPLLLSMKKWQLAFCLKLHGISFQTFFRLVSPHSGGCVLVVEDEHGAVFGAFADEIHKSHKYYGSGGGHYALIIQRDFLRGSSECCPTFNSPPLATTSDFTVKNLQVWLLTD